MNSGFRLLLVALFTQAASANETTEFCLDGELDLGARYQGMQPGPGETHPTSWCVTTEDESPRVFFRGSGRSNPDMDGSWSVAYFPPDTVRIVNRDTPPDIEFRDADISSETRRIRRLDPRRLLEEMRDDADTLADLNISVAGGRLTRVASRAPMPLRGDVEIVWQWDWSDDAHPGLQLIVDDDVVFRARGSWRTLREDEAEKLWLVTPGDDVVEVPGENWPARVNMRLTNVTDNVYLVRGVRTGFQHMVVDTDEGLVVADAPSGWIELHQIPPSDLVPGLGVSGLSERLIEFLRQEFPGRGLAAVALTHFHDDHAGGARAFAAADAKIYATSESAEFLTDALNRSSMPADRLAAIGRPAKIMPVAEAVTLGSAPNRVKLVAIGPNPHSHAMLGIWALDRNYFFVSDIHVPRSDAESPRAERAGTECWFAEWAVQHLPPEVRVINSHSEPMTPVSRLAMYLEHERCRK